MTGERECRTVLICVTSPVEMGEVEAIVARVTGGRAPRRHHRYDPGSSRLSQLPWRYEWPDPAPEEIREVERRLKERQIGYNLVWEDPE